MKCKHCGSTEFWVRPRRVPEIVEMVQYLFGIVWMRMTKSKTFPFSPHHDWHLWQSNFANLKSNFEYRYFCLLKFMELFLYLSPCHWHHLMLNLFHLFFCPFFFMSLPILSSFDISQQIKPEPLLHAALSFSSLLCQKTFLCFPTITVKWGNFEWDFGKSQKRKSSSPIDFSSSQIRLRNYLNCSLRTASKCKLQAKFSGLFFTKQ